MEATAGIHTGGCNSGVVHWGFNAKRGTLKAMIDGNLLWRGFFRLGMKASMPYMVMMRLLSLEIDSEHAA